MAVAHLDCSAFLYQSYHPHILVEALRSVQVKTTVGEHFAEFQGTAYRFQAVQRKTADLVSTVLCHGLFAFYLLRGLCYNFCSRTTRKV